jgi:hypothetical protein
MRQYSLFTHGTALQIETPQNLASHVKVGWGTEIVFQAPVVENLQGDPVWPDVGPGSWFHIPLPSTLNTFGRSHPLLDSVTLLIGTSHCRIKHLHVWDGAILVEQFNNLGQFGLKGDFLQKRNIKDVDPELTVSNPQTFVNTRRLSRPHKVFSAIGLSFFACWHSQDFHGHNPKFDGAFPQSLLTVAGGGGQFLVDDSPAFTVHIGKVGILFGP